MTQQEYKAISLDTLRLISTQDYDINGQTFYIRYHIKKMLKETKVYNNISISKPTLTNPQKPNYKVANQTTIKAALDLSGSIGQIGILNFASAIKAGGGWLNGRIAQEEDIMRKTTVFPSILIQNEFYKNHSISNPFYSDRIIYSPNVFIIKDDDFNKITPIKINVLTSAAINLNDIKKNSLLNQQIINYNTINKIDIIQITMLNRIRKILLVAIENNIKNIVLGAFGCGVFGHDAIDIANIFQQLLIQEKYEQYFNNIIFAVLDNSNYLYNFNAFNDIFGNL